MLKKMRLGGIVLASLLAATGCQNEEIVQSNGTQGQAFTLVASKGIQSRTHLKDTEDGKKQTVWSEGDKIYVSSKDGNVTGVLTLDPEDAGSTSGTFTGFVFGDPAKLAYSVYPVPTDGKTLDLSEVLGGGQLNAPMIGAISQDPNAETDVQFENVCGVLYVDIEDSENKTLKVSAKEGADTETKEDINFATTATISWDDNTKRPIITFEGSTSEITISNADGDEMYIPYFTTEDDLNDVTFYAGNTPLNDEPIDLSKGFVGGIVMDGIKSLKYEEEEIKVNVAKIGDVTYTSLQEAIEAVKNGETITFINNLEQTDGIVITDKNITIDLNGKTYTVTDGASTNNRNFKINGSSVVTIKNGTMVAAGEYSKGAYGTIRTEGTANVTLEYVKLYNYRGNGLNVKASSGTTVTINNTEIYSEYGGGIEAAGGIIELNNVKVEQKGMYTAPYNSMAISVNNGGQVTVNSGTYTTECITAEEANGQGSSHGPWTAGVLNSGGTLIINGGTFSNDNFGDNSLATNARGLLLADTGANIQIKNGTFNAVKAIIDITNNLGDTTKNPSAILSGGTFSANPCISGLYASELIKIADEYKVIENNGIYYVVTKGVDFITPSNHSSITIENNTEYQFKGDFENSNVSLVMAEGIKNVVFDGTNATNINELIITQNGALIDNANTPKGERSGKVTVQYFKVLSQINVFACKTEVVVQNNTAEALMIYAGNCDVKVLSNTIDANFESHPTYRNANATWNTNNYGIALNIFDYNLWLDGNTVTDAIGHAIGINGWEGTIDNGDENKIESFKNNVITVNSTTNTKRAAFKVWDDETYASNDEDTNVINETAQAFIKAVLADGSNTFCIIDGYEHTIFSFYNVITNN